MDVKTAAKRRKRISTAREKRWSMNSQRLEEIVAQLMKPISDVRRSFDTDLSALLEEYLTEAGLHALEQDSDSGLSDGYAVPNFAELALLLQQSANIYGRKVDCLHARVLSVCDALHTASELANTSAEEAEEGAGAAAGRARRGAGDGAEFTWVQLTGGGAAAAEGAARPPPTLPRQFAELQPRAAAAADLPLRDLAGEPAGAASDYCLLGRLHAGALLDELEEADAPASDPDPGGGAALLQLQAALAARAAAALPAPPSTPAPSAPVPSPPATSTPVPSPPPSPSPTPPPSAPPPAPPPLICKQHRKRPSDLQLDDVPSTKIKMMIIRAASRLAVSGERREFCGDEVLTRRVVGARAAALRALRQQCRPPQAEFRGFDSALVEDIGGFAGWAASSAACCAARGAAAAAALAAAAARVTCPAAACAAVTCAVTCAAAPRLDDSDDDGFFEQSSLGDSDASRIDDCHLLSTSSSSCSCGSPAAGAAGAAGEGGGVDVRRLAARVLAALRAVPGSAAAPLSAVLAAAARCQQDVSKLFLATLFLANAGNVELRAGAPLSLGGAALRLLTDDARLYSAAARDHHPPHT